VDITELSKYKQLLLFFYGNKINKIWFFR